MDLNYSFNKNEGANKILEQLPIIIPKANAIENQKSEYEPKIINDIKGIRVVKLVNKVLLKDSFTEDSINELKSDLELFLTFSLILSKITTVSFTE